MKTKSPFFRFLALSSSVLLAITTAQAATLYWDGADSGANAQGGASGVFDWINGTNTNWDTLAFGGANSVWTNGAHTAVFGGTAGTVNIGAGGVTVGGLTFNTTGYVINAGSNGLNFSSGTNVIQSYIGSNTATTSTITGMVGGTGANLVFSSHPNQNTTTTFNGTSTGGWTGTTTINQNYTVALAASSQALLNTTGITLNGGVITLTNTITGSENTLDRINDGAAIASYGNGTITIFNSAQASRVYSETIGAITHYNGQLNIGFNTVQNQAGNTQTLNVGGLTRSGSTSTIAINSTAAAGAMHGNSYIRVSGVSETAAGEIVGPWMTAGGVNTQSDWAVYTADEVGGYRRIGSKGGSAVAETLWTSSSATGNYNASATAPTASPVNTKLTANRFVNTLRVTFSELTSNVGANWSIDGTPGVERVNFATHNLSNGDVVHFRSSPTGLQDNRPYYVINAIAGTSFQLSLTPGGTAIDLTSATSGFMSTGINLNGNTLGLNGYINAGTGTAAIGGGSASTLTLATATTGNLYLHGPANMWIDPSIKDNGAGVLTLVKSGTTTLTLSGDNTYTGGTVINGGTINFATAGSWVSGQNITFGGSGTIAASVGSLGGGQLDVNQGAVGNFTGTSPFTFTSTTGAGMIVHSAATILNLGNASTFTGDAEASITNGGSATVQFSNIGDSGKLMFGGGNATSTLQAGFTFDGASSLTFSTRQIALVPRSASNNGPSVVSLTNNSSASTSKWVINTDLLNSADRAQTLNFDGTNTGNNEFKGAIGNSTASANALSVSKAGNGKWILSGTNTYTGTTVVNGGTLQFAKQVSLYNNTPGSWTAANINVKSGATLALNVGGVGEFTTGNVTTLLGNLGGLGGSVAANQGLQAGSSIGFDTTGGTFTVADAIANSTGAGGGAIGLTKLGTGTLVMTSATSSYTGATTISGGTLSAENDKALGNTTLVTVNGGNLDIRGATVGTVTLGTGADLMMTSGILTLDLGTLFDQIIGNGASSQFDISGGTLALNLGTGFDYGNTYAVLSNFGGTNSVSGLNFTGISGYTGTLGTNGVLSFSAIPEPSTFLLSALGVLLLLRRRRQEI